MTAAARFTTVKDWLRWQETLHPQAIELGLQRVAGVAAQLACQRPAPIVISVAGTNGKGSSVALLEAILLRAGYRVGAYSSPHLLSYNERIRIDAAPVSDDELCAAFARVDAARAGTSLTYFEFGTLAALDIMTRRRLEVALLEVGLGGRLDAVNLVDADVALITRIGIDHTEWLGPDRDAIGREKAGIMRTGRPAVCADLEPPAGLLQAAEHCGAVLAVAGRDFHVCPDAQGWAWRGRSSSFEALPQPALPGAHQVANAAGVLSVLEALASRLPVRREALVGGLLKFGLPGRIQHVGGAVDQVLDVSHNAQAAQALADTLRQMPSPRRCYAVLGMMKDKQPASFVQPLLPFVDTWYASGLQVARASPAAALAASISACTGQRIASFASMSETRDALQAVLRPGDRVVVCGSFYTVAEWCALEASE